jgi:glycosyltransferase involved in cell wall biosynthesis
MGRGALVLYLNTAENSEVAAGAGIPFEQDLTEKLRGVLSMSESERAVWRARALERARERYTWEGVAEAYERLFADLTKG